MMIYFYLVQCNIRDFETQRGFPPPPPPRWRPPRPASQSRIPVEHRQVRIRDSEEGTPARGWAYFTYPARLTPLDTPRKVYTNPLAKSCISCEKGWIYRKNRYNDPEAGLCSGKDPSTAALELVDPNKTKGSVERLGLSFYLLFVALYARRQGADAAGDSGSSCRL